VIATEPPIPIAAIRYARVRAHIESLPVAEILRRVIRRGIEGDIRHALTVRPRLEAAERAVMKAV